ncbi:hypothetical protein Tco_0857393 [Tanacetum coccineum]|uniref:Uncharacterized protein n=1 Tax=Tanacetum coccineum TaxID=301880 RepID=A0ABQ5BA43_9ASTR
MKSIQTFLKKFNRISFRETPKVLLLAWENFFEIKHAFKEKQHQPEDIQELLCKLLKDLQIISEELEDYINTLNWNCHAFYDNDDEDDDEEYTIAIAPVLPTMEPDNSLSMGDEHLSTIPEKKESSVEDLVLILSESKGISDSMCDVPFCENSHPLDALKDHYEIFFDPNDDYASSDVDPLYSEDIDYVDASPPDSELVSLEEGGCEDGGRWGGGDGVWLRAAAAADDEGVSNGDDDETKVMKDVMGMTMVVDS